MALFPRQFVSAGLPLPRNHQNASHRLIISASLLIEIEKAFGRKLKIPPGVVSEFIHFLKEESLLSPPADPPDVPLRDKDDLIILASALGGAADLIVTGDKEILDLRKAGEMEIVSPRGFWEKLKKSKKNDAASSGRCILALTFPAFMVK